MDLQGHFIYKVLKLQHRHYWNIVMEFERPRNQRQNQRNQRSALPLGQPCLLITVRERVGKGSGSLSLRLHSPDYSGSAPTVLPVFAVNTDYQRFSATEYVNFPAFARVFEKKILQHQKM